MTNVKKLLLAFLLSLLLLLSLPAAPPGKRRPFRSPTPTARRAASSRSFCPATKIPASAARALNIGFDPDVLQYDGCTTADGFDPDIFSAVETEGQLRIAFTDRQADFYMTGRLLTVRFRIVGETESDSLSRLTLSAPAGAVADVRYRSVECRVTDGGVYVGSAAIHLLPGAPTSSTGNGDYVTGVAPQHCAEAFLQQLPAARAFAVGAAATFSPAARSPRAASGIRSS